MAIQSYPVAFWKAGRIRKNEQGVYEYQAVGRGDVPNITYQKSRS